MTRIARPAHCICCEIRNVAPAHETAHGVDLCLICFDEAGNENAHSDGHHEEPATGCHICENRDPHAAIRPQPQGAGRVASEADGRLKANTPQVPQGARTVKVLLQKGRATAFVGAYGLIVEEKVNRKIPEYKVLLEGQKQVRWFYKTDVTVLAPSSAARRQAQAAA